MHICSRELPRAEPGLTMKFPELLPKLRPYQRRAAFWMVQRERGLGATVSTRSADSSKRGTDTDEGPSTSAVSASTTTCFSDEHPLWFSVLPLDGSSEFFFNPYTYCSPMTLSGKPAVRKTRYISFVLFSWSCFGLTPLDLFIFVLITLPASANM